VTHRWQAAQTYQISVQAILPGGQLGSASVPFPVTAAPVLMGTVRLVVDGSGTVASQPAGIACPSTCDARFPVGTAVRLSASPGPTARFGGWAGPCTGTGGCQVTVAPGTTVLTATLTAAPDTTPPSIAVQPHGMELHPSNFDKVCGRPTGITLTARVTDAGGVEAVWFTYQVATPTPLSGTVQMPPTGVGSLYEGTLGSFALDGNTRQGGAITVVVHARDRAGNGFEASVLGIVLKDCPQIK